MVNNFEVDLYSPYNFSFSFTYSILSVLQIICALGMFYTLNAGLKISAVDILYFFSIFS